MRMLVEHGVSESPVRGDGACLTDDTIAAVLSNTLLPEERVAVDAHLATCGACRTLVARLAPVEQATQRTGLRLAVAGAAAVAAAVLLVLFAGSRGDEEDVDTDAALAAASVRLAADRPDLFGAFTPLGPTERRTPRREAMRGGLVPLHPTGRILEERPNFTWAPEPGTRRYEVALYRSDGSLVWQREAVPAAACDSTHPRCGLVYPEEESALAPGTACFWELRSEGALGSDTGRLAFQIATAEEREAFVAAVAVIEAHVDEPVRALLTAHVSLRRGLLAEAEALARRHVTKRPDDRAGRETLHYVLTMLGAPEARELLDTPTDGDTR